MAEKTIFTRIVEGEIPAAKVYEDDEFLAFMDIRPVNKGHVLVITKDVYATLKDMPEDMVVRMFKLVHKLTGPVMEAAGAPMFNWYVIGDEVPHAHIHIVPRFEGDRKVSLSQGSYDEEDEIEKYAEKIRENMQS